MKTVEMTVGQFKARFSDALASVAQGDSITVTYGRHKRPVAVFAPHPEKPKRKLGHLAGKVKVTISPDWEITEEEFFGL